MNNKQRTILKNELKSLSGTDLEVLQLLNAKTISLKKPILTYDIKKYLALQDKYLSLKEGSGRRSRASFQILEVFDSFDINEPIVLSALTDTLTALIVDGIINQADKDAILALGESFISKSELLGLGSIKLGHIKDNR